MSLKTRFFNQLSKVIEWKDSQEEILWYKFPNENDEIKNASKLIVAPGQGVVLVYQGEIKDIILEDGIYALETDNHPFITTLVNLRQGFESEHKLKVYFFKTTEIINQYWGTPNPIKYFDKTYNIPIEMGVNGNYSFIIKDVNYLFKNIIGSRDILFTNEFREPVVERITENIVNVLADKKFSYAEIDANLKALSEELKSNLANDFKKMGLEITDFRITGTAFDEKTKERIDRVSDVAADAIAAKQAGLDYVEMEKLKALRDAAKNEGGLAGIGAQMGVGMEIGKMYKNEKDAISKINSEQDPYTALKKLKLLLDENIITNEEFEDKKKEILNKL